MVFDMTVNGVYHEGMTTTQGTPMSDQPTTINEIQTQRAEQIAINISLARISAGLGDMASTHDSLDRISELVADLIADHKTETKFLDASLAYTAARLARALNHPTTGQAGA